MKAVKIQQNQPLYVFRAACLTLLMLCWCAPAIGEDLWIPMDDGLMTMKKVIPKTTEWRRMSIHGIRIDLQSHDFKILRPAEGKVDAVSSMVERSQAIAGINGSFFFEDLSPMGLLISEGIQSNGLRKVDWGVFFIDQNGNADLIHTRDWTQNKKAEFAIQTGPRLVVNGKPLTFRDSMARRSAICVLDGNTVALLATDNAVLMRDLAVFLSRPESMGGMGCRNALNLDGGSSTHFVVPGKNPSFGVSGFDRVPVAIGVFKKPVKSPDQRP